MIINKKRGYDRKDLARGYAKLGFTKGVEVGVRWGYYSRTLCSRNKKLHLVSVDPYSVGYQDIRAARVGMKKHERIYKAALERLKPFNCKLVRKTSLEAVLDFPYESIDFVYIDGCHQFDYVMCDIIEWGKRVRRGGVISGHDYYRFINANVVDAVDIYCRIHKVNKINITDEKTPSWWFKRTW
jgi:SAM-dependent methyltransferase